MKKLIVVAALIFSVSVFAQKHTKQIKSLPVDTAFTDYDALFSELDIFLDAITSSKSFAMANIGIESSYLTFRSDSAHAVKKILVSPSLSYFHKSGLGISGEYAIVNDGEKVNPYQFSLTGYYDYVKNRKFFTGVSLSHYFTKQDLPFYPSPIENEASAYFTYRQFRIKPSVNISYGWGNSDSYTEQQEKAKNITTNQSTAIQKTVADFSITTSVKYHFYLDDNSEKSYVRFTPQISLVTGTRHSGFNELTNIHTSLGHSGKNLSFNTQNLSTNDDLKFQPLSFSSSLKAEYVKGNFFVQPQLILDYYFPASTNNLSTGFMVNAGFIF